MLRSMWALPAACLALAILLVPSAWADDPPATTEEKPKPAGVVKIDLVETIDGKETKDNYTTFLLRKKLRELGFVAYSERPVGADEVQKKKKKKGDSAPQPEEGEAEARPEPDLIIKGTVAVKMDRTNQFYGADLGYVYAGTGDLRILEKGGANELGKVADKDEWLKKDKDVAQMEEQKRIGSWLTAAVLKQDAIRGRLAPAGQAALDRYVADVETKRVASRKDAPPPPTEPPAPPSGGSDEPRRPEPPPAAGGGSQ